MKQQNSPSLYTETPLLLRISESRPAGATFAFLQAILGLQPDAPRDRLFLDPSLPDWFPDLVVQDLRVGKRKYDLRFWRDGATSRWEVIQGDASRVTHRDIATGPLLSGQKDDHRHLALAD
jgi:hypothetical protein